MNVFGTIIFLVVVVLSIAQKIKEQAEMKRRQQNLAPRDSAPTTQKAPQARELLEALLGVEIGTGEEEGEWVAAEPAPRRELARSTPAPPPLQQKTPTQTRAQQRSIAQGGAAAREEQQRVREQLEAGKRRQELDQRQREQQTAQVDRAGKPRRRQQQQRRVPTTASTPRQKRDRLFGGKHEIRKAIVFAEILGPPKAFEDSEGTQRQHQGV